MNSTIAGSAPLLALYRKASYLIAAFILGASTAAVVAQEASKDEVIKLDQVVTIGSRFNDRTVTDSPVPIDVITGSEVRNTGYTELNQVIQAQVPSFNFPRPSVNDGTDHVRPATIRGLSPDQVLVLINGKRRHTSALVNINGSVGRGSSAVDMNAIPIAAVGGIEVLRDGASAQYGSDAIAGVINLTLRKDTGSDFTATVGQTYKGDGAVVEGAYNGGARFGDSGGFINVTGAFRNRSFTNRAGVDGRQEYFGTDASGNPTALASSGKAGDFNGTPDPRETTIKRNDSRQGDAESHEKSVFVNADAPIDKGIAFYAFGGASERKGLSAANWRRPADNNNVRAIYPNGFLPKIQTKIYDRSLSGGLTGDVGKTKWDLSETYGNSELKYWTKDSLNATYGAASPTSFYDGKLFFHQATTNLDLSQLFDVGLSSPLKAAAGVEYRWEDYQIKQGDDASWANGGTKVLDGPNVGAQPAAGAQGFGGFRPTDATDSSRNNIAGYVDVENQLTDKWLLDVAGRGERYSDAGRTFTGKIATRYQLFSELAARASVNSGFRAPSLAQQFFTTTSTNFLNIGGILQPVDIKTFQVSDPAARLLGATNLKPEKSKNFSGGLTFKPNESFDASLDYYYIKIVDRIVLSSNYTGASVTNFLSSAGFPGIGGGRYFTNAVDTRTQGLDGTARYLFKFASGDKLVLTSGININTTRVTRIQDTPATVSSLTGGTPIFDRVERVRLERGTPRTTINVSATYDLGRMFTLLVREVRYGNVTTAASASNPALDQTYAAKYITDVDFAYHYSKKISAAIGANNLFDVYPDKQIAANNTSGINVYNGVSPFGYNGGFYYARLDIKL